MTKKVASTPAWLAFIFLFAPFVLGNAFTYGAIIAGAFYIIWISSLGIEAHCALPESIDMPIKKFKFALAFFACYGLIASLYFSIIMPYAIPFHIFAMFCIFYSFYFVAKAIRSIELSRVAKFEDWFALFFGLWFFPIGVWFIQPKIQRIVIKESQV